MWAEFLLLSSVSSFLLPFLVQPTRTQLTAMTGHISHLIWTSFTLYGLGIITQGHKAEKILKPKIVFYVFAFPSLSVWVSIPTDTFIATLLAACIVLLATCGCLLRPNLFCAILFFAHFIGKEQRFSQLLASFITEPSCHWCWQRILAMSPSHYKWSPFEGFSLYYFLVLWWCQF